MDSAFGPAVTPLSVSAFADGPSRSLPNPLAPHLSIFA